MFYLSNGPCKLAPLRPEIHIFSRTHQFSIRQVIQREKKIPKGSFDFCTFQTQLYFIPARMMGKTTESSEGELRAVRGNGAENSSWSKGRRTLGTREDQKELSVLPGILVTPDGVLNIVLPPEQGGRQQAAHPPQDTYSQLLGDLTGSSPSLAQWTCLPKHMLVTNRGCLS